MINLNSIIQIFKQPKLFTIVILGMVSGMPMSVFLGMLSAWLHDMHIALEIISTFSVARLPYSIKYIWAPIIDHVKLPIFYKLGRRRSWMLLTNIGTIIALIGISLSDPVANIKLTILFASLLGLCAATYDIAFDAFRIESLPENQQALGVATTTLGYRLGMLLVGFGSLVIADMFSWQVAFYYVIAAFMLGTLVILISSEHTSFEFTYSSFSFNSFKNAVVQPFQEFFKRDAAVATLMTVILYKLGEAMLSSMTTPFYLEIGFSKIEIAKISKVFGVIATLCGIFIGAYISDRIGNLKALLICGTGQMLSNLMFVWQNYMGHDIDALIITLAIENVTGGMGSAALISYMGALCNRNYTATHYALLTSFASFANNIFTIKAGYLVRTLGWDMFFVFTTVISLPALLLIAFLDRKFSKQQKLKQNI